MKLESKYEHRSVLTKREVADVLGITISRLGYLINRESFPAMRITKRTTRILVEDVEKLLEYPEIIEKLRRMKAPRGASSNKTLRAEIYSRDKGLCGICGLSVEYELMHLDHIIPVARGGSDKKMNLQSSHALCNAKKKDKMPEEL